jgi:predicted glycosyltransferase
MHGLVQDLVMHRLNIDPIIRLVKNNMQKKKKKKKKNGPNVEGKITEEVEKMLKWDL